MYMNRARIHFVVGRNCDENVNDCEGDPCVNNGICVDGVNEYFCHCQQGYTGKFCEIHIGTGVGGGEIYGLK